jgi:hypothetical protein
MIPHLPTNGRLIDQPTIQLRQRCKRKQVSNQETNRHMLATSFRHYDHICRANASNHAKFPKIISQILAFRNPKTPILIVDYPSLSASRNAFFVTCLINSCSSPTDLVHGGSSLEEAGGHVSVQETLNAASFASTLLTTSGSGSGSTFIGCARGQLSHLGCPQREHSSDGASA